MDISQLLNPPPLFLNFFFTISLTSILSIWWKSEDTLPPPPPNNNKFETLKCYFSFVGIILKVVSGSTCGGRGWGGAAPLFVQPYQELIRKTLLGSLYLTDKQIEPSITQYTTTAEIWDARIQWKTVPLLRHSFLLSPVLHIVWLFGSIP